LEINSQCDSNTTQPHLNLSDWLRVSYSRTQSTH